ncbi:hypothetical protein [Planomicrobium okeanokoites]|uniref:hypothetical protein n=1 Tax=Planomicrobium okeanokoites TaxID=244 RepID=UPI0009FFCD14|nr:hypothetical protein [Planomicrobium okeanokoites]
MENRLYRLINNFGSPYSDERETYSDYLDFQEALKDYKDIIADNISIDRAERYEMEPYFIISDEAESNPGGEWRWCRMRTNDGEFCNIRIEPIQAHEAEYFASEDIKAKYDAIYGFGNDSTSLFTRLFKRKK